VQVDNALQQKISRYYVLFKAFDIRHATNTEYLDFPIFVFNLILNLNFLVTVLTSLHVPLAQLNLATNPI
jgi:hypothetical protein